MATNAKRVFYVRYVAHQSYFDVLAKRPDISIDRLENDSDDAAAAPIFAAAHAYQIGSARDEIAQKYHVTAARLTRSAKLLIVWAKCAGDEHDDDRDVTDAIY